MKAQRSRWIPDDIETLPHWARVAFAARCGRIVLPLFERYWGDADAKYLGNLETAIGLAEQSAAEARAAPGVEESGTNAIKSAGAALARVYGFQGSQTNPADEHASTVASFVAKVAEWAAKSAQGPEDESARAALEAYTFARDAAHAAEEGRMIEGLQRDFDSLYRVAKHGKWADTTPVPPTVFDLLSDEGPGRPWWRF
jgi:hypothetical protein